MEPLTLVGWQDYELEPDDGMMDANAYPNPANGQMTRNQLQSQHSQIRDYINTTLVPTLEDVSDNFDNYYTKSETYTKQEVQDEISSVTGGVSKGYVDDQDAATLLSAKNYTDSHASDVTKAYVDQQDGYTLDGTSKFTKLALGPSHIIEITDSNNQTVSFSIEVVV